MKKLILPVILVSIPVIAWLSIKPVRLLAPQAYGMYCRMNICVESQELFEEAERLFRKAKDDLAVTGIVILRDPRIVYCKTNKCYKSFGGGRERAISFPYLGVIISEASWQGYITKHELIHWYQFQELGSIKTMLVPDWFREGMAYHYSGAPNSDIPEHYLEDIEKFKSRYHQLSISKIIDRAKEL